MKKIKFYLKYKLPNNILINSMIFMDFIVNRYGVQYKISWYQRFKIIVKIIMANKKIIAGTTWQKQILLVKEILNVPKEIKGDVVECGSWNGASAISLSIACALSNRRLFICDSFEGLPDIQNEDDNNFWKKGWYNSSGIEPVKSNIVKYGCIEVCFNNLLTSILSINIFLLFTQFYLLINKCQPC